MKRFGRRTELRLHAKRSFTSRMFITRLVFART
jgi:hypothetical protein